MRACGEKGECGEKVVTPAGAGRTKAGAGRTKVFVGWSWKDKAGAGSTPAQTNLHQLYDITKCSGVRIKSY